MEDFVIISTDRYRELLKKEEEGLGLSQKVEFSYLKKIVEGGESLEEDRLFYYNKGLLAANKKAIDEKPFLFLKSMRIKKGFCTARSFADHIRMDYANYNRLESGKTTITKEKALMLGKALKMSVSEMHDFMLVLEHEHIKKFRTT
jgi:transcriptional regulator with XRE-family HTH domain